MGLLINGRWDAAASMIPIEAGRFVREDAKFRGTVTPDGAGGFKAEPGRYHLWVQVKHGGKILTGAFAADVR